MMSFLNLLALAGAMIVLAGTPGYTASKSRKFFQSPKSQMMMNRTAGSTMIATGAVIAIKS